MSRKAVHVSIDLDIHAVTCPGVWLCPKGDAMLQVSMLGISTATKKIYPTFPLLFHESFHFRKTFIGITSLSALQKEFDRRLVRMKLIQWHVHGSQQVLLAAYCSPLSDLLYPQQASQRHLQGVDVNVLMETTACFPGIISPKIEISTKVVIEEMISCSTHDQSSKILSYKTLCSKKEYKRGNSDGKNKLKNTVYGAHCSKMRQKPVCHTKPKVKCYYCKQRIGPNIKEDGGGALGCMEEKLPPNATTFKPYCINCGDYGEEIHSKKSNVIPRVNLQAHDNGESKCLCTEMQSLKSTCECSLCCKYNKLFNNTASSLSTYIPLQHSKLPLERMDCSIPQQLKGKCGPCLPDKSEDEATRKKTPNEQNNCENYKNKTVFKSDIDSYYNKLYQRVSRRSNCGDS